MKAMKRILCFMMAAIMVATTYPATADAAWTVTYPGAAKVGSKIKLNKKKLTLTITDEKQNPTATLKIKGTSKKVGKKAKWSSSDKSIAKVKKGKVTAKSPGKATITCRLKGKKYTCKVTVVDDRTTPEETTESTALEVTIIKASENNDEVIIPDIINGDTWIPATNRIIVTYDGKDVTQEAKYETSNATVGYVETPGIIEVGEYGSKFALTISYKDISKTIYLRKEGIWDSYIECYCGAIFYGDIRKDRYREHAYEMRCGGYFGVPYVRYIDVVMY